VKSSVISSRSELNSVVVSTKSRHVQITSSGCDALSPMCYGAGCSMGERAAWLMRIGRTAVGVSVGPIERQRGVGSEEVVVWGGRLRGGTRGGPEAGELVAPELHGMAMGAPDGVVDAVEDMDEEESLVGGEGGQVDDGVAWWCSHDSLSWASRTLARTSRSTRRRLRRAA
jgi:hypothetical protein